MAKRKKKSNSGAAGRNLPGQATSRSKTTHAGALDALGPVPNPVITRLTVGTLPGLATKQRRKLPQTHRALVPGEQVADAAKSRGFRRNVGDRRNYTD